MFQTLLMTAMLTPAAWGTGNCGPVGSRGQYVQPVQQFVQQPLQVKEAWSFHAEWKQCFLYQGPRLIAGFNPRSNEFRWYLREKDDWGPAVNPPDRLVAGIKKMKEEMLVAVTTLAIEGEQVPPPGITPIDGPANRTAPPKAAPAAPGGVGQAAGHNEGGRCRTHHRGGHQRQHHASRGGRHRGCR